MCVSLAGLIVSIRDEGGPGRGATVEFSDGVRTVDLVMTPDAREGDHIIAHSGYAVRVVSAAEAASIAEVWASQHDAARRA